MTDCTKTCRASEGREKALRWRSIPAAERQDTLHLVLCGNYGNYWDPLESDWEPPNEAELGNEALD